jgi:ATP-dependent Lon protease
LFYRLDTIVNPLLDRLEVISISGYTKSEKLDIAESYLVPRQTEENGLSKDLIKFERPSIEMIISGYTKESGVRELERNIGAVCRRVAVEYSNHKQGKPAEASNFSCKTVTPQMVQDVLGIIRFEDDFRDRVVYPGVSTGMAWTESGGKVLYIETSLSPGQGQIHITGQLGEVMKESIYTALGWIRSNIGALKLSDEELNTLQGLADEIDEKTKRKRGNIFSLFDLHVHFPAAAVPKDGPSAGIAITTALVEIY